MSLEALRNDLPSVDTLKTKNAVTPLIFKTYKVAMVKEKGGRIVVEDTEIPGHEVIGHIVVVRPYEKKWEVGDRVGGA